MAKVIARKETGRLLIDFTYRGVRCREQTALPDTVANRKRLDAVVQRIRLAQRDGSFAYVDFFPGSSNVARFDQIRPESGQQISGSLESMRTSVASRDSDPTPTFRTFADQWMRDHEVEWRRSHIKVLRSTVDGHLLPHFANKQVGRISKGDVLAFRTKLAALPGRGGKPGLSNKRINGILAPLRQMLNEAAEVHGFPSPVATYKPLRIRKTDVEPFTLDEVQLILKTVRADYKDYFAVRFLTGMRTGEAHGLKWQYVDFANRLILIRETFVLGEDEYTKTDSSQRDIRMNQVVFEALQRQHAATGKVSEYVFCNREGKPIDNKNFTDRVWSPLLRHLGLKPRRAYQTRHTAATLWLASGEAPEWIARQLGHSSTEMLFRVYSRFVPNLTRQDGSAMDRLLASRFASGQGATAPRPADSASDAAPPQAQPPPTLEGQVALMP